MDCNVVDCEMAERDCEGGSLDVLKDVQRAYEHRLEAINRTGGSKKLQKQVQLLQCWVRDLVEQNALLVRTVEQLEQEVTSRLLLERRRHAEVECEARAELGALRRRLASKDGDMRGLLQVLQCLRDAATPRHSALANIHFNEITQSDIFGPDLAPDYRPEQGDAAAAIKHQKRSWDTSNNMCDKLNELTMRNEDLQKEVDAKDREIRRLNQSTEQYEQKIMSLKKEMSLSKCHTPDVTKLDAEVTADICCPGLQVGDVEPVKDYSSLLRKETAKYQERLELIEDKVKSSSERVRALRETNVALATETHRMRQLCAALAEQARLTDMRAQFAYYLMREMRRQIIQAKAKIKVYEESSVKVSKDIVLNHENRLITSTLNTSCELCDVKLSSDNDVVPVDRSSSPPIVISDGSVDSLKLGSTKSDKADRRYDDFEKLDRASAEVNLDAKKRCPARGPGSDQNESIGSSSAAGSASSRHLESQLSATLQVLKNKEETVRVQAESLALAEERIAELAARAPRTPFPPPQPPLHSTRSSADGCCVETSDFSGQTQHVDHRVVSTLQDNISVIEDLYRECFYETAKQEELIDLLRTSCLDMRSMERQKEARIGRLQSELDSQKWSLKRCQDIALEVENLKSEISMFLNSSNHDSGMWERAEEPLAADVADDLHHIAGQLLQLKALLQDDCSCGLDVENMKLKKMNEKLELQLGELRNRVCELEAALEDKENVSQRYYHQIQLKDQELVSLQQKLAALEEHAKEHRSSCEGLNLQVQQLQVLLQDRSEELSRAQRHCEEHVATIGQLRLELARAETVSKEQKDKVRSEVSQLSAAVRTWREQLESGRRRLHLLDEQLQRERQHCAHLNHHYQEKVHQVAELQGQLEEARAQGAALCEEAQCALSAVRRWLRCARRRRWEKEQTIKEQDKIIRILQERQQSDVERSSSEPSCSRQGRAGLSETPGRSRQGRAGLSEMPGCSRQGRAGGSETPTCSKCLSLRDAHTSVSERSSLSAVSAPTPPRRSRKKPLCNDMECQWPARREASVQRPTRAHAHTRVSLHDVHAPTVAREMSPTDELLERVDRTHEALAEARRRWRLAS